MASKKNASERKLLARGQLMLALVACDRTFERASLPGRPAPVWVGRCIHCRAALVVEPARPNAGPATVEHIVPRSLGGTDTPDNLALACARCNHQKGSRLDPLGLDHPRLSALIERLQNERARRHRVPPEALILSPQARAWLLGEAPVPDAD